MIMAGGTGGHVFPALAVADYLRARDWRVVWLGAQTGMEATLVPQHGYELAPIRFAGLRGKGLAAKLLLPLNLLVAFWQSLRAIRAHRPDVVLGMGGYIAFPGGMMAALLGRPLAIHEQNSIAGLANRVLVGVADRILVAFPGALPKSEPTGNPVREAIARVAPPAQRFAGRSGPLRVLVVGGSLGAAALNERVPQAIALLAAASARASFTSPGRSISTPCARATRAAGVAADLVPFIEDMAQAYADADVAICRAGAITVAELAAVGVASILVPFPFAVDDHQTTNARYLADAGAALLVQQRDLTAEKLADMLRGADARAAPRDGGEGARARQTGRHTRGRRGVHGARPVKHKVKRIHFVGIGGSGMSGIAEVLVNLGYRVTGSDIAANGATERLAKLGARVAHRPRRRARRRRGCGGRVDGGEARQPGGRRRASAPDPGRAARADARRADAPQAGRRGRRHPRQDHHDEPRGERARRGRARPDLRDRRSGHRGGVERAPRRRRLHRRRGGRVRRVLPPSPAGDGGRHQHRRRPHGDVRARFRAAQGGVRAVPPEPAVLRQRDPVRGRRARARDHAVRVEADRDLRLRRGRDGAGRERGAVQRPDVLPRVPRRRRRRARRAAQSARPAQRAERARRDRGRRPSSASRTRRSSRRSPSSTASGGASSATATTATLARRRALHARGRLRSPPGGDGGDARGGARRVSRAADRARVPAAPVHAHPRPVRGLRAGAVDGGRARSSPRSIPPASRRSSPPTAARSRARCASRGRSSRSSSRRSPTCRWRSYRSCATATSS